jgi:hypothetical protein
MRRYLSRPGLRRGLTALLLAGSLQPLAAQQVRPAALVWPAPPEQARIRYVGAIASEADVGRKESWLSRIGRSLVGGRRSGVIRVARPFDVAAVAPDRIFVSDGLTRGLLLFDPHRKEARIVGVDVPGGLSKPMGVGAGGHGSVLLADQLARRVVVLDSLGRYQRAFGDTLSLLNPVDVAVDTSAGRYYVVDSYQHQVVVFDARGEVIQRLGRTTGGVRQGAPPSAGPDLSVPVHLGENGDERPRTHDVVENRGEAPGEFKYPWAVAVGADGNVYVSDQMNFRVQLFDRSGKLVRVIGGIGTGPGSFARPKGVAVDSEGHLYAVDAAFGNVQVFNPEGALLLPFGGSGEAAGRQILPLGIATDGQDRIYVVDRFNNRIQIYEYLK